MVKLHFKTTDEFESLFKAKTLPVTRTVVSGIQEAVENKKRSANLFQVTFDQADMMYEISLPKSQWEGTLEHCLNHLHKVELADEQIDCWSLLEEIKQQK